jgi:molybdopterin-guanine dinucleotide biosynthesis protein A/molybdopterin converting factor small subunit
MEHRDKVGAVVLAGGRSSRMGRPKALLPFDGTPLIVHIVGALRALFDEVVVVSASGQLLPDLHVKLVHDEVPYQGPVGGITYGLRASECDAAFVTSCDSAFLNRDLITHLISQVPEHDVVVPRWEGRFQPLHAVYRRTVVPLLEEQLSRGELRPVFLFDRVRTRVVEPDEIRRFDPEGASFFNMNTPDDYTAALERWTTTRRPGPFGPGTIDCTVELFGVARLVANVREVPLVLPASATLADSLAALAHRLPALIGRVITADRRHLVEGCTCNLNGREFVRTAETPLKAGDRIVILSADAGG